MIDWLTRRILFFFFFIRGYDDEKFVNVNRNFEQSFEEMKR